MKTIDLGIEDSVNVGRPVRRLFGKQVRGVDTSDKAYDNGDMEENGCPFEIYRKQIDLPQ
jgi:hypothetical protein